MAKVKATAKAIKSAYGNIISIPYCDLQYVLTFLDAAYYTCGVYGWNSDVYIVNCNTVISTGYRPISGIYPSRKLLEEYNQKGKELYNDWEMDYHKKSEIASQLVKELCEKAYAEKLKKN